MAAEPTPLEQIRARLATQGQNIPCLPPVLLGVQKAIASGDAGAKELAHMLLADPSLTARVIRMANSSYYASEHKIRTVTSAILMMGFETVRNLVLGLTVYDMFGNLPRSVAYRRIWRHSLCCAVCSRRFAEKLNLAVPEQAFVAGLLHDLGKLILGQYFPEQYAKVAEIVQQERIAYHVAEQRVLNCTHMEAGKCLAEYWGFPEELSYAITNHEFSGDVKALAHDPVPIKVIRVANQVALYLYQDDPRAHPATVAQIHDLCLQGLNIGMAGLLEIFAEIKGEVYECARVLNIAIDEWKYDPEDMAPAGSVAPGAAATTAAESSTALAAAIVASSTADQKVEFLLWCNELADDASDFSQFVRDTASRLFTALSLESFFLLFKDPWSDRLEAKFGYGNDVTKIQSQIAIRLDKPDDVAAAAYLTRKPAVIQTENLHLFSRVKEGNLVTLLGTYKIVALPILLKKQAAAVMVVSRAQTGQTFEDTDIRVLSAYGRALSSVLSRTRTKKDDE